MPQVVALPEGRPPGSQDFSHRPSLRNASTRRKWCISVEDLAKCTEAMRCDFAAMVFARVQHTFAPSVFEYGKVGTFEGTIEAIPHPILIVAGPGSTELKASRYLLVSEGKHGADSQVAAFTGKNVQLRCTKIYRDNQTMIEIVTGSTSVMGDSKHPRPATKELGSFELTGEIVHSKCYLGVMNPGNGKVHRDSAVRCLSGGIPPVFATNDFNSRPAILVLADHSKDPLAKEAFLGRVAQPGRIRGKVIQTGDTLFLETEPHSQFHPSLKLDLP